MKQKTFELTDAEGVTHKYITTLHPASEGCLIAHSMTSESLGPLVEMIGRVIMEEEDMDISLLTPHIQALIMTLDPRKQRDLLKYTARDGELLSGKHAFDRAFEGNYGEWMHALTTVVMENQFVPLVYISRTLGGVLSDPNKQAQLTDKLLSLLPAELRAQVADKAEAALTS